MSTTASTWDDEYARVARATSQLRATGSGPVVPGGLSRDSQIRSISSGLQRLMQQLGGMESNRVLSPPELGRRRKLVEGLQAQIDSMGGGGGLGGSGFEGSQPLGGHEQQPMSATAMALRNQDEMIDELAVGVGRLKDQTRLIGDEARSHNRLLDDMESDVEKAHVGMEAETRRAQKLREDKSVWKLYMIIAGLSILLFILILMGLS